MRTLLLFLSCHFLVFAAPATKEPPKENVKKSEHTDQDRSHDFEDTEDDEPQRQTGEEVNFKRNFIRTLIAVVVIIVLALIALWIIKKMSSGHRFTMNSKRNIKVLEHRAISGQTVLYHLEVGGKQIILAESKCQVKTVTELDWPMLEKTQTKKL